MTDAAAHAREVEAWHETRYATLRRDTSWLTLAGLDWLRDGVNRVGSDPGADVRLTDGPPDAGRIVVAADGVTATGSFRHGGEPVNGLPLESDAHGEPTMLELGDLRFCLIERGGRPAIRTWNLAAEARSAFSGIDHWPVDPAWRLAARFEPVPDRTIGVPDVLGFVDEQRSPGDVAFEVGSVTHRLQGLRGGPNGELWLVFADATNGHETYGGGRFLYTGAPDADGTVVVDFNRAYNPPCVFSPFATCPLPWEANRLPIRIEAGERMFEPQRYQRSPSNSNPSAS
jgi:uncharacterized protein (DUF1684 family)